MPFIWKYFHVTLEHTSAQSVRNYFMSNSLYAGRPVVSVSPNSDILTSGESDRMDITDILAHSDVNISSQTSQNFFWSKMIVVSSYGENVTWETIPILYAKCHKIEAVDR